MENFEFKYKRKDGSVHPADARMTLIKKDGRIVGVQAILRDMTESKESSEAIEKSAMYLDVMGNALMVVDAADLNVIKVNRAFTEIWGYSDKEAIGKSVFSFFPKSESPKHREEMGAAAKVGTRVFFESIALTKDKKEIPVSITGKAIRDDTGKPKAFVASFTDISEWKKTEAEIKKRAKELERFNRLAVGREIRMVELKKRIMELEGKLGEKSK